MLKKITYPALLVLWMVVAVACQKETVKPFNPANGSYTVPVHKDGDGDGDGTTDPDNPSTTTTDSTNTTGVAGEDDDEGITDGGGSSEQDAKSKRVKKP